MTASFSALGLFVSLRNFRESILIRDAMSELSGHAGVKVAALAFVHAELRRILCQTVLLISSMSLFVLSPQAPFDAMALTYSQALVSTIILWDSIADRVLRANLDMIETKR